jgi:hypothetical protein
VHAPQFLSGPARPVIRARIIRQASPPRPPGPPGPPSADDESGDRYVPPPPAPLPKLDPVAKGAWAGLLGGPGYLLAATLLGWQISGIAAVIAIVAFIAGFALLVVRMGDRPGQDGDGDGNDGAVV